MSWITESSLSWFQKTALSIIKSGTIPQHIAFIMDGSRRFAKKSKIEKAEGHSKGFDKLAETLKWCLHLGVTEVTVYAFSIENFKRSDEEVDALMELARQKFEMLLEEKDKVMKQGINIRVIGDLSRVPPDLYKLMAEAVCTTKNNNRARLNIAFSYTARNEITEAVRCIVKGVKDKKLNVNDVNEILLEKCLYTEDSNPPDLLIRTSGEIRFSDFMLWQSSFSCVYFTPLLWPEFTLWELLRAIFHYQRNISVMNELKSEDREKIVKNDRTETFISDLYKDRYDKLKMIACNT